MKNILLPLFALLVLVVPSFATNANDIVGTYWGPDKDGQIEIYKVGEKFYGKVVWAENPRKDSKNPDASLRDRDIVGAVILNDFVFDGKDTWKDGTIYDTKSGKTYSCQMTMDDKGNLNVRGYIGVPLLGRTEVFTRVN